MATSPAGAIYPDLENRSVLVTGGGSGIGEAIVRAFARQKSKIGFIDINAEASRELADIAALRSSIARIKDAHGPISVLVNNAAHDERHKTEDVTPEYWDGRI